MEVLKYPVRISWPDPSLTEWGRRDGRDVPIFIPISADFPELAVSANFLRESAVTLNPNAPRWGSVLKRRRCTGSSTAVPRYFLT
jgi:hypothetical protein